MQSAQRHSSSNERLWTARDNGECDKPAAASLQYCQPHLNGTQSQQEEKWTCPCGGSCSDGLSRLECRLAVMESRLADFEALIHRSSQSQSSNWRPDISLATGSGGNAGSDGRDGSSAGLMPDPPSAGPPSTCATSSQGAEPTDTAAVASTQCDDENGTPLNLVFSEDNDTCSTAWTDLGPKHLNLADEDPVTQQPDRQFEPLHLSPCVRHASNSLLTTNMNCAERLLTPAGEFGSSRSCLEPGPPREMAGPPASVSRDWDQQPLACCRLVPTAAGTTTVGVGGAVTASALVCPRGGDATCETATANCAVNLVLRSRVTQVRGGGGGGGGVGAESGCVTQGPPESFVCVDNHSDIVAEDLGWAGTVSTGEQTTASVSRDAPLAARRHLQTTIQAARSRSSSHSSSGGGDGGVASVSNSSGGSQQDCRLCSDLMPYAHRRLGELERDGVRRLGSTPLTPGRQTGHDDGAGNVCIQRSGFSKLDTVLIAGLVLKAAGLHESEGDQAGFVRLALRRMGFECAVVIGRHFTGCICSLDSSRLLVDIGERSCLIFSFFQPAPDFSQLPSAK